MKPLGIIGAIVGAVIGAVIWGAVAAFANLESAYIAWGIGALVGVGAVLGGGRGAAMGVTCAIVAVLSILAGKMMVVHIVFQEMIPEVVEARTSEPAFEEFQKDAADFAKLESASDHVKFMIDHDYTDESDPDAVAPEELASFRKYDVPELQDMGTSTTTYDYWRNHHKQTVEEQLNEVPYSDIVADNLDLFDLLFAVLGIVTAYRVGSRMDEE
ncbi:MAG: hypothetical protein ABFD69_10355 [Candidatus Sumerlaeia bacterium]